LCDDSGSVNFSSSLGDLNLNGELEVSWCLDKSFLELAKFVELLLEGVSEVAASLGVSSSWSSGLSDSSSDNSRSQDSLDQTASASVSDDLLLEDSSWLLLVNLIDNLVSLEDLLDVSLSSLDDLGSVDLLSDDLLLLLGNVLLAKSGSVFDDLLSLSIDDSLSVELGILSSWSSCSILSGWSSSFDELGSVNLLIEDSSSFLDLLLENSLLGRGSLLRLSSEFSDSVSEPSGNTLLSNSLSEDDSRSDNLLDDSWSSSVETSTPGDLLSVFEDLLSGSRSLTWLTLDELLEDGNLSVVLLGVLSVNLSSSLDDLSLDNLLLDDSSLLLGDLLVLESESVSEDLLLVLFNNSTLGNSSSNDWSSVNLSVDSLENFLGSWSSVETSTPGDLLSESEDLLLGSSSLGWLFLDELLEDGDLSVDLLGVLLDESLSTLDDSVLEDLLLEDSSLWLGSLSILLLEDSNLLGVSSDN